MHGEAVAVVDEPRFERSAGRPDFIAGRKVCDPQLAMDLDLRDAERGEQAHLRRHHAAAARNHDRARSDVLAGLAYVLPGLDPRWYPHAIVLDLHMLLHHDGVGPAGHDRSGHDSHRLRRSDPAGERLAREGRPHHPVPARRIVRQ